jgi:hypothetical protein
MGAGGATIGKTIFTCVYIEKKSSPEPAGKSSPEPAGQFQSDVVQI